MKDVILGIISLILITVGFTYILVKGQDRKEVVECRQWQEQAAQYDGFYLTHWQADQCTAHGITINAPIK